MAAAVIRIAGMAVIAVSAVQILRQCRPELAVYVSIAAALAILALCLDTIQGLRQAVEEFLLKYSIGGESIKAVLKITGIAYIAQFAADACRDCGESAVASKVELAGRLMMVAAAFPLISSTMAAIMELMSI